MDHKIGVLIAAGQEKDREKITAVISQQNELSIVGIEKDDFGTLLKSERLKPDMLIMDINFYVENTPDLIRIICRRSPFTKIIILGNSDDVEFVSHMLKAGISAYLLKNEDFSMLAPIIKIVAMGGCYINASINKKIINQVSFIDQFPDESAKIDYDIFSPAERCIVTAMANGFSDEEISKNLHLSLGSIRNCLTSIRKKIKMKSRIEIVVFSLIYGLVRLENLDYWRDKIEAIFLKNSKG